MIYNEDIQKLFIESFLTTPMLFVRASAILKPEYFDEKFHKTVEYLLEYSNEYSTLPPLEDLKVKTGIEFKRIEELNVNQQMALLDEIELFCRRQAIKLAVLVSIDKMDKGEEDGIEKIIKDATLVSLQRNLGSDLFEDPEKSLKQLFDNFGGLPSGWKTFDQHLYGGFSWGELDYVVGKSGMGKSLVLQNLALNFLHQGYQCIYISLELSENLVKGRLFSMLTGNAMKDMKYMLEDTCLKVHNHSKKTTGSLRVKFLPTQTDSRTIESFIQEYEIQTNIIPQIIIIDYADLMRPNDKSISVENIHLKDKFVCEELRNLVATRTETGKKTSVFTASQIGKPGMKDSEHDMGSVSGGVTKTFTCDNMWTVEASPHMRERGEMEFRFLKTRNSGATGHKFTMCYDPLTLKISDVTDAGNISNPSLMVSSGDQEPIKIPERNMTLRDLINKPNS